MALHDQTRKAASGESASRLLAWYDLHHRELPWRITPSDHARGARPDPYRIWLSEVMLQQTTVEAVKAYFRAFVEKWPDVNALAGAQTEDVMKAWAGLGYYSRARNLKACADLVALRGGRFPETEAGLRELPGIGAYTAAAIAAIAFDHPAAVVDGNVERVISRLFSIATPLSEAKAEIRAHVERMVPQDKAGRLCPGYDGSGGDDLHAAAAALHALPVARGLQRDGIRRPRTLPGALAESREAIAARRRLRRGEKPTALSCCGNVRKRACLAA